MLRVPTITVLVMVSVFALLVSPVSGIMGGMARAMPTITICTDRGVTQIILDDGGGSEQPRKHSHDGQLCPFCFFHHTDVSILPDSVSTRALPAVAAAVVSRGLQAVASSRRLFLTGRPTRAPPLTAV